MSDAIRLEYEVPGDDFTRAGEASSDVKRLLKKLGVAPGAVRRVAIARRRRADRGGSFARGGLHGAL